MANIVIIGSGVVGTATGKGFAQHGHGVSFVDVNATRVDALRKEGYAATTDVRLPATGSVVFLTLPTPNDGQRWDLHAFQEGTEAVAQAVADTPGFHTVVSRSTVPPGTLDRLVRPIMEEATHGSEGERFGLASNPEFLRASCALEDFLNPRMTVIGSRSKRTLERMEELLRPFGGELRPFLDPRVPELIKAAHNLYNATKISFWNEIWQVADRIGVDVRDVADTVAVSSEASYNPLYGVRAGAPYGGACLPKDTKGFLGFAREHGVEMQLLAAVDGVNEDVVSAIEQTDGHRGGPKADAATDRPADVPAEVSENGDGFRIAS